MSDNAPPEDGKWTIRGMQPTERAAALAAARRADKTVAEWIGEAIRAYIATEHAPQGTVLVPLAPCENRPPIEDIARVIEIAQQIATMRGTKVPRRLATRANQLLGAHLGVGQSRIIDNGSLHRDC